MTTTESAGTPFHLAGNFRPVTEEQTAFDLPVSGTLPPELRGSFLRNGPNPTTPSVHWFVGEGMIHGIRMEDGQAKWYRNRWVRTASFNGKATFRDAEGRRDLTAAKANTHVLAHGGRILALVESSFPYEVTAELETVGPWNFDGRLNTAMTAHPKICPTSGEMHFFGYGYMPPYLTYHVADAAGTLITSRVVDVPTSTMMHDFNLTEHFVVFMDLPIVFDLEMAMGGNPLPYRYDPGFGARLGVLSRRDPHGEVRWFEIDPCYVFHALNAHDRDGIIILDVCRLADPSTERVGDIDSLLWRWTIDLEHGTVTERQLDDRPGDFPRVDDRLTGFDAGRGWVTSTPGPSDLRGGGAIVVYDLATGVSRTHRFGPGRVAGEAVFAPSDADPGGPGWLLAYVYDATSDGSELVVLDPDRPEDPPVATVRLPARVPYGFHGSWLPA